MPYIDQKRREDLKKLLPETPGELNYEITFIVHEYIKNKGLNYTNLNEVIGVLECAKQELYRVVASPYEDIKRKSNGSISELDRDPLSSGALIDLQKLGKEGLSKC